jgi:hypothetical protein
MPELLVSGLKEPVIFGRGSAAALLLRLRVRIPPGAWRSVACDCCVLSGTGFCDGSVTCIDESYRVSCN